MSLLTKIRQHRTDERRALLCLARDQILASAKALDVPVRFFGSFAEGRVDSESDLDVMILGDPAPNKRLAAILAFERIASELGAPVDIVVQSEVPELYMEISGA